MAAEDPSGPISHGELRVRVDAVERDVGHIEQQVNAIRDTMATKADMNAILSRIEGVGLQYHSLSRPNHSLTVSIVATGMLFLTMIGGFAYWPINTATSDLKAGLLALADKVVPLKQYEAEAGLARSERQSLRIDLGTVAQTYIQQQRYNSDMARLLAEHNDLRNSTAPRSAYEALARRVDRMENLHISR